jgi:hypothetical protein
MIQMTANAATSHRSIRATDGLWLGLALLLHAALLLLPLHYEIEAPTPSAAVTVSLSVTERTPLVSDQAEPPTPLPDDPQESTDDAIASSAEHAEPGMEKASTEDTRSVAPESGALVLTTARLLDIASRFKWPLPEVSSERRLGVFAPPEGSDKVHGGLQMEENLLNGMTVPARTEIVDRWLAADGSHNVVINTPTGHTLCGRQQAWNPMNPLMEHVMMWRPCGGGGKRTFKMPPRDRSLTESIP